jgi:cytochrome P450
MCETAKQVLEKADFTAYSGLSARVPPDHTRIRKVVTDVFTPRRYRVLAPFVCDTIGAMLDAMLAKPNGDLVADLAYDLPALTILKLLGVPAEKVAEVKRWAKSRVLLTWGDLSDAEQAAHTENLVAYWNLSAGAQERHPCPNLVRLCRATAGRAPAGGWAGRAPRDPAPRYRLVYDRRKGHLLQRLRQELEAIRRPLPS